MTKRVRFLSSNPEKISETQSILGAVGVQVVPVQSKIAEIQSTDIDALVRDKVVKAYAVVGHPIFVEHTGLSIDSLNGLPGGLTQIFWDTLEADRFSELFGQGEKCGVIAKTHIGYCDGRRIHTFHGEVKGTIAPAPRGSRIFQWDCVFIPEGYEHTFAELGEEKNRISMRRRALDRFADFLRDN